MDELNYMKQLVREWFDLSEQDWENISQIDANTAFARMEELDKELKELSGYED